MIERASDRLRRACDGVGGHGPTLHVKITEHFLLSLADRPMGPEASMDLVQTVHEARKAANGEGS